MNILIYWFGFDELCFFGKVSNSPFQTQTAGKNQFRFEVNKGRYFRESGEFQLMAGPFVAALEYATGRFSRGEKAVERSKATKETKVLLGRNRVV